MANARFILAEAADVISSAIALVNEETTFAATIAREALERARQWVLRDALAGELPAVQEQLILAERAGWWDTVDRDMHGSGRLIESAIAIAQSVLRWNFVVGPSQARRDATDGAVANAATERQTFLSTIAARAARV